MIESHTYFIHFWQFLEKKVKTFKMFFKNVLDIFLSLQMMVFNIFYVL